MIKTKIRVPWYTGMDSREIMKSLIDEENYPAYVTDGFIYDEHMYTELTITHLSNYERIKRWDKIEKEFYKRDYERLKEDYSTLYDLQILCGSIDSFADLLFEKGNIKDGETLKFYTDYVISKHKKLLEEREKRKAWNEEHGI